MEQIASHMTNDNMEQIVGHLKAKAAENNDTADSHFCNSANNTRAGIEPTFCDDHAIISAEERKLLDDMDKVVSRACFERGYESNEELSTPEELGSCSILNVTDYLVNSGHKPMIRSSKIDLVSHDRQLLDAMLTALPFEILGRDPYKKRNEVHIQHQIKTSDAKSQDEPNLDGEDVLLMSNQRPAEEDEIFEVLPQHLETVQNNATEEQNSLSKEKSMENNVRRPPMKCEA